MIRTVHIVALSSPVQLSNGIDARTGQVGIRSVEASITRQPLRTVVSASINTASVRRLLTGNALFKPTSGEAAALPCNSVGC